MVPLSSRERQILAQLEASLARDFPDDPAVQFGRDVEGELNAGGERDLLEKPPREGPGTAGSRRDAPGARPGREPPAAGPRRSPAPPAAPAPDGLTGTPHRPGPLGRLIRSRRTFVLLAVVSFVLLGTGMVTGNLWVVVAFVVTWSATFLIGAARMLAWSRRQGY
ncbi:hypothetical protein [Streptomyces sp. NPDC060198]|uniref:hypothetical protein n=1 Tax=Streptomyces sp. NPDC060198 TaxID=3347070 RepID=UPI00365CEA73